MKIIRKLFSVTISFLMVACTFAIQMKPVHAGSIAASIGNTTFSTLDAAITASKDGDVILLNDDITVTSAQTISNGITLDLNGHTITAKSIKSGNDYMRAFTVNALGKTVTFIDSSTSRTGKIDSDYGSVKVAAGTMNFGTSSTFGGNYTNSIEWWGGIKATGPNVVINVYNINVTTTTGACFAVEGGAGDVLNIYGGTFKQSGYASDPRY